MLDKRFEKNSGLVSILARHPNAANLIMVLMVLFGLYGIFKINTQFFPDIAIDAVNISAKWSGASAEDVEANILQVIEPAVRYVENIDKMSSTAREGTASITLEFKPGTDMQKAIGDVDAAIKSIGNLPEDADTPTVSQRARVEGVATLSISGKVPEETLRIYAKQIRDDLIDRGIDRVDLTGLRDRELKVDIHERELRRLGLSISDVRNKIANNSRNLPSGQTDGAVEKQLRAQTDFKTPEAIKQLEVKSFESGEKVRLQDIADISFGYSDDTKEGLINGNAAIEIQVSRAPTSDTLVTAKILDSYLVELEKSIPAGITLQKYNVRSDAVKGRISLLLENAAYGLLIVVCTLFLFLNARIAFWVAAGIPVALLATVGFMWMMGQTINMISLFGMIMMLGIIVDDAIVVGEHTATKFAEGDGPYEAAEKGAGRMITPVAAAMLTTIASFSPILLISGVVGQIMGALPFVVIAVLIASLIECFFILPGHLAHTLQPNKSASWSYWRQLFMAVLFGAFCILALNGADAGVIQKYAAPFYTLLSDLQSDLSTRGFFAVLAVFALTFGALIEIIFYFQRSITRGRHQKYLATTELSEDGKARSAFDNENFLRRNFDKGFFWFRDNMFDWLVKLSYRWRYVTVAIAGASMMVLAFGLLGSGKVPFVFFPNPESENIRARLVFNAGLPQERVKEIIRKHEETLYEVEKELGDGKKLIAAHFVTLGSAGRNTGDNLAQMNVQLVSSEERITENSRTSKIVNAWKAKLPKLAGLTRSSISQTRGGPPGRDVELQISGQDAATLKKAADEIVELVSLLPSANGASDNLPYGKPELIMTLTPRGTALGFNIEQVSAQVREAFSGSIARRFAVGDEEVSIRVSRISKDTGAAALRNFELKAPSGQFVQLTEVVKLTEQQGFAAVRRIDGKTLVSITADLDTKVFTTEQAEAALVEDGLEAIATKHGVSFKFDGRTKEREAAFKDLTTGVIVALAVIYIILAWVFSSYWRPFAVMLIIPFGVVGAVFGHFMMGYSLSVLSLISILGLAGILVNDSIILVSRLDERIANGDSLFEAATGASRDRLRAVLLTSLTTIGGLIPLMFETSVQAQFILPMAVTITFGLGLATLLVLFLVPAFVAIGADVRFVLTAIFSNRIRLKPAE
ncbi:MAG: efflux RND transporter permease subunit [Nitratireductor sp.]